MGRLRETKIISERYKKASLLLNRRHEITTVTDINMVAKEERRREKE